MNDIKRCPKCEQVLPIDSFGWRNAARTIRQAWCRSCLNQASVRSRNRPGRDGLEHLRNHFKTHWTICGQFVNTPTIASHFYDEQPTTNLPPCPRCADIDERACVEAAAARTQHRGPMEPDPYRIAYLSVVNRLSKEQQT